MRQILLTTLLLSLLLGGGGYHSHSKQNLNQITFGPMAELGPTISPDGQLVAFEYFADTSGPMQLWVMPREGPFSAARPVVKDGKYHAGISWSPDSQWIAYMTMEYDSRQIGSIGTCQIDKTNVYTGKTIRITQFPHGTSIGDNTSWSKDNEIAFAHDDMLYAVPDIGGEPHPFKFRAKIAPTLNAMSSLAWSPNAEWIAFISEDEGENQKQLWIFNPSTGKLLLLVGQQKLCCVSWPSKNRLLLSRLLPDGSIRVNFFNIQKHKFDEITQGPTDLAPTLDISHAVLLFNHSPQIRFEETNSLIPKLHIWKTKLSEIPQN